MPPLVLPSDLIILQDDLNFSALEQVIPGSRCYFAGGEYNAKPGQDMLVDAAALKPYFDGTDDIFQPLGELAEKPGKVDSKMSRLKTQNYLIPGRRSSSVELTICGLSDEQKAYLESNLFQGVPHTIVLSDKQIESIDPELDEVHLVILSGMSWVVDWSGEADGLWSVVISSELQGATTDIIFPVTVPVYVPEP